MSSKDDSVIGGVPLRPAVCRGFPAQRGDGAEREGGPHNPQPGDGSPQRWGGAVRTDPPCPVRDAWGCRCVKLQDAWSTARRAPGPLRRGRGRAVPGGPARREAQRRSSHAGAAAPQQSTSFAWPASGPTTGLSATTVSPRRSACASWFGRRPSGAQSRRRSGAARHPGAWFAIARPAGGPRAGS